MAWILPLGLLVLFWLYLARGSGIGQAAMSFGKSRARLVADRDIEVSFRDVAGCEEAKAELAEVVTFLRHPERFTSVGAKIPKGVLLVGPPGTGKTLLARAVAGEAGVPFFSLSGSDFVEMFVGVGAARVRDLFVQAKQNAPCIIFIDELDAIGRARGVRVSNVNDEREHTLNQLLVEMDGFEANAGVILLAATNRPDVLDAALLRPGRFDRQVVLDSPDVNGRRAILEVHARNKPLAKQTDLQAVARATPGFSGADLANAMNEAALTAARRGAREITQSDLEEAVEKVVAGPERKSRRLDLAEKRRVAFHESGHAIVASYSPETDPVHKISIVPRGRAALGYTLQLPTGDQHLLTRSALFDRIRSLLGGRAAEDVALGQVSTGAENDLEQATNLARSVVARFGMGENVRLLHCGTPQSQALAASTEGFAARDCSERTAALIDKEAGELLDQLYAEAKSILEQHRDALERIANALLERETLDEGEFRELLQQEPA
jgi:cell division protease FtsH